MKENLSVLLLESDSCIQFFQRAYQELKATNDKYSYPMLARAGGIASSSYLREVLSEKRSLTPKAFVGICKAFKIDKNGVELLRLMLARENESFNPQRLSLEEIENQIFKFKKIISKNIQQLKLVDFIPNKEHSALETAWVVAALGDSTNGAKLEDIAKRTKLNENTINQILKNLCLKKIVIEDKKNYYHLSGGKVILESGEEDSFLKNLYVEALTHHLNKSKENFKDPSSINVVYTFSTSKKRYEENKEKIKQLMQELVDEQEEAQGEDVMTMVFGLSKC